MAAAASSDKAVHDAAVDQLGAIWALLEALVAECEAMVRWATDRGLSAPPRALDSVTYTRQLLHDSRQASLDRLPAGDEVQPVTPYRMMAEAGELLMGIHGELSRLVHPARPQTITRMAWEARARPRLVRLFGPLPIVRRLVIASLVLLVAFVLFASSDSVRHSTQDGDRDETSTTTVDGG